MSIQTELDRLQTAKTDLKTAIEGKGVTVPDATTLDGYGALVAQISAGGSAVSAFSMEKEIGTAVVTIRQSDGQTRTLSSAADSGTVGGISFNYNKMNWDLYAEGIVFWLDKVYFPGEYLASCAREQAASAGWLYFGD